MTYVARTLGEVRYGASAWRGCRVGIFRREGDVEEQVGEYERNHGSLHHTFFPLRLGETDLALYSPDYTCTRLLALPSCRDIGGEEPSSGGFCPVEFLVPSYVDVEYRVADGPPRRARKQMPEPKDLVARTTRVTWPAVGERPERNEAHHEAPIGPRRFHDFGFVAGCVWGDDSSWKLQYLDLSRAADGILRREERFGYLELPDDIPLDRVVSLIDYQSDPAEEHAHRVNITTMQRFDLRDGRRIDPLDG